MNQFRSVAHDHDKELAVIIVWNNDRGFDSKRFQQVRNRVAVTDDESISLERPQLGGQCRRVVSWNHGCTNVHFFRSEGGRLPRPFQLGRENGGDIGIPQDSSKRLGALLTVGRQVGIVSAAARLLRMADDENDRRGLNGRRSQQDQGEDETEGFHA